MYGSGYSKWSLERTPLVTGRSKYYQKVLFHSRRGACMVAGEREASFCRLSWEVSRVNLERIGRCPIECNGSTNIHLTTYCWLV